MWIWVCDISCGFTRYRFLLRRVGLLAPQRQQRSHSPQTLGSGHPGRTNSSCDYETAGILGHPHDLSNTRGFMKLLARSKLLPRPAYSRGTIRLSFPLFYLYYTPSFSSCQLFMTYCLIFFTTFLSPLIAFSGFFLSDMFVMVFLLIVAVKKNRPHRIPRPRGQIQQHHHYPYQSPGVHRHPYPRSASLLHRFRTFHQHRKQLRFLRHHPFH